MLLLVIKEPRWKTIFGIEGIAIEAVIDELRACFLPIDKLLGDRNCLRRGKAVFYEYKLV